MRAWAILGSGRGHSIKCSYRQFPNFFGGRGYIPTYNKSNLRYEDCWATFSLHYIVLCTVFPYVLISSSSFIAQELSTDKQLVQQTLSEPDTKGREH